MKIKVKAAAKINLSLDILGKRADGYHELRSVMQTVSLYEYVTLEKNDSNTITLACNKPGIPVDDTNIAARCARSYFNAAGIERIGLNISIQKNIPVQAGLAGGSADGAAVLRGLNELYGAFSEDQLYELGAKSGADIPFCLMGGTVLCEGIGDSLTRLERKLPDCSIVIVKPDIGISTKEAYFAVDRYDYEKIRSTEKLLSDMSSVGAIGANLGNDFAAALALPEIEKAVGALRDFEGCAGACMSGSGSAVFGIFEDELKARECADVLRGSYSFSQALKPVFYGTKIIA